MQDLWANNQTAQDWKIIKLLPRQRQLPDPQQNLNELYILS